MWYFINKLQEGRRYNLNGQVLEFIEQSGEFYYFYVCKYNEWSFDYELTEEAVLYTDKELTYIKKIQEPIAKGILKKIKEKKNAV
jgi:hypothetical protein